MIRNSYGKKYWTFPGGGVDRGETVEHAAMREVQEEVGLQFSEVKYIGNFFSQKEYKKDIVSCFFVKAHLLLFQIDESEVGEAAWFSEHEIPAPVSPSVAKILELYHATP